MLALLRFLCTIALFLVAPSCAAAQVGETAASLDPGRAAENAGDALPFDPAVTVGTLPNGLRYYIRQNAEPENRAELRLVVRAGSLQEDEDQRGLAHFLEHMAFNGTARFEKQELIRYLESIGMRFGADLNAATSYDHTVYTLTVPTDADEPLETAFRILEDWAHGVALDPEEIEAERGVILSEWRARLGVGTRVRAHTDSVLLGASRYLDRQPIGLPERIQAADRDALVRFYRDWYRPDLMAVVVVGDVDVARIESLIHEHFHDLAGPQRKRERTDYPIPTHDDALVSVITDPELTGSSVELIQKFRPAPVNSRARIREEIVQSLFASILNERLRQIATRSNPPFLGASTGFEDFVAGMRVHRVISVSVRDGEVLEGFRAALAEVERIAQHGITPEELDREKRAAESRYSRALLTRSKVSSDRYAASYVHHFLTGRNPAAVEDAVALSREILAEVTAEEVAALARNWKSRENVAVVALIPEKHGASVPTADQLLGVLDEVQRTPLAAEYAEAVVAGGTLLPTLPEPGAVVEEREVPEVGITVWTLANQARVILKPTDFTPDQVLFYGYGWGGTSVLSDEDLVHATLARSLPAVAGLGSMNSAELRNAVVGKHLSIGIGIKGHTQTVSGQSSSRDLETMLQLVHLHFTAPRLDDAAIRSWKRRLRAGLEGRSASPEAHFADTLSAVMTQYHPRTLPLTAEQVDSIDPQRALEIYRDRFGDASGFTFIFVGEFQLDSIRPLIERYIGGLPSKGGQHGWRDTGVRAPSGKVEKVFRLGREPRARIAIIFNGPYTHSTNDELAMSAVGGVLSTRLRERLREALGGTYSVHVHPEIQTVPEQTYNVRISFDAAPDRVEEMRRAVFEEIERLRKDGPTADEIRNLREEYTRQYEVSAKDNSYWLHAILSFDQLERPLEGLADFGKAVEEQLNVELVHEMSRQYLDPSRYVQVIQLPAE